MLIPSYACTNSLINIPFEDESGKLLLIQPAVVPSLNVPLYQLPPRGRLTAEYFPLETIMKRLLNSREIGNHHLSHHLNGHDISIANLTGMLTEHSVQCTFSEVCHKWGVPDNGNHLSLNVTYTCGHTGK